MARGFGKFSRSGWNKANRNVVEVRRPTRHSCDNQAAFPYNFATFLRDFESHTGKQSFSFRPFWNLNLTTYELNCRFPFHFVIITSYNHSRSKDQMQTKEVKVVMEKIKNSKTIFFSLELKNNFSRALSGLSPVPAKTSKWLDIDITLRMTKHFCFKRREK